MSAYITEGYVANAIGDDEQNAFAGGSALTQLIQASSALVDAALYNGGYSVPVGGTAPDIVMLATLGALLPMLYGRRGIAVPERFQLHTDLFDRLVSGEVPIPSLTPSDAGAVGGVEFTGSSTTVSGDKPQIFTDLRDLY